VVWDLAEGADGFISRIPEIHQNMEESPGKRVPDGISPFTYANGLSRPEDIFGSLEVDGNGNFVGDNGNYQASGTPLTSLASLPSWNHPSNCLRPGTYRMVTRNGM
jgi:hypothetical protein